MKKILNYYIWTVEIVLAMALSLILLTIGNGLIVIGNFTSVSIMILGGRIECLAGNLFLYEVRGFINAGSGIIPEDGLNKLISICSGVEKSIKELEELIK